MLSFTVEIDFGRDGAFAHPLANVTGRTVSLAWRTGMDTSDEAFAPTSRLDAILSNDDNLLAPERADSPYAGLVVPGLLVRVSASLAGETAQLWIGKLTALEAPPGSTEARLVAEEPLASLLDAPYAPALLRDVRVDAGLTAFFESGAAVYPYESRCWLVGVSVLGEAAVFENVLTAFDTARTTLRWLGDVGEAERVGGYLRALVSAEAGGRFFWDGRAGVYRFHNRHHDVLTAEAASLDGCMVERVETRRELANVVTVRVLPREVGAPGTILWQLAEPVVIRPGKVRRFHAAYADAERPEVRVAAVDVLQPERGADFVAACVGVFVSADVPVSVTAGARSALIDVVNPYSADLTVLALRLRGTPLRTYAPADARALDAESIAAHERRERLIELPAVDEPEFAEDIARMMLARLREPLHRWHAVHLAAHLSETLAAAALRRTVGDHVRLSDAATGHDAAYILTGEAHTVDARRMTHTVRWTLKPLDRDPVWVLGHPARGMLGGATVLAL